MELNTMPAAGGPRGDSGPVIAALVADRVLDVPDFPQAGVVFKDLSPVFADGEGFRAVIDGVVAHYGTGGFQAGGEAYRRQPAGRSPLEPLRWQAPTLNPWN
jgi:hypothetical protein